MRYADTGRAELSRPWFGALRFAVSLFWVLSAAAGVLRMASEGFSADAVGLVLRVWYGEALGFAALFGLGAVVHGLVFGARPGPRMKPRHRRRAVHVNAASPLERTGRMH